MRPPTIPQTIHIHEHDNRSVKIMKTLYNSLVEYREVKTNRIVIQLFISLPSRKDFPEYFDIIDRPISMYEIKKRIESNYYRNEEACIGDFKLMFSNCKIFNEDLSQIFKDAVKLEEIFFKRYDQLVVENGRAVGGDNQNTTGTNEGPATPSTRRTERLNHNSTYASSNKNKNKDSIHSSPIANNHRANHHNNSNTSNSHHLTSTPGHNNNSSNKTSNNDVRNNNNSKTNNEVATERDNDSNSNMFPGSNGNDNLIINHNYHNDTSIDSSSNLSLAANTSTSDKPTKRLKKDPDAPKRRLLTGYIIYAAEVRKEYVDKHPDQDFGFISRLIGNDWKALPRDLRVKYDQRALVHNKKIRERALLDSMMLGTPVGQAAGDHHPSTTKLSKKRLAKEMMRQNGLSTPSQHDNSSIQTPARNHNMHPSQATNSNSVASDRHRTHSPHGSGTLMDSSTQTAPIRFVEPPQRKRIAYAENFRRYISSLDVPNQDLLDEELLSDRPNEDATNMLGAGTGRHGSHEAALWALRDFMLQDSATMRWSLQPYLCY